ncbi:MAG: secretin N-terminal domain-containing protein [Verrucomicrobiota bacterium]
MSRPLCIAALLGAALISGSGPEASGAPAATPVPPQADGRALPAAAPQAAVPPPPAAAPQTAPPQAEVRPPPVAAPPTTPPDMVRLQYPNSDVADVLHLYETLTNKKLVMDNFVQGKVNIFISKDVPREEAIKIIEMNLLMNGYSLVPAELDIVKVIGTGRNPRAAGVPIISDDAEIPQGDHVISFLFKLRYADPIELQQVLGQYLQPAQPYTSFLALPKSSSILVTENSSVIRSLVHIIDQVDVPPAEVVSEFIKLQRADASKVVDMLKDIFEKTTQQQQPPGQPPLPPGVRPVRPAIPAPQAQVDADIGALTALSEESVVIGKIKLAPDVRTNRIHVITRPVNMPFIRKLIAEFDANVEFGKPVTRPLQYISAAEVLPVLVQALTEPGTEGGGQTQGGNPNPQGQPQNQQRRPLQGNTGGGLDSSSSSGGNLNVSEELSTQAVDTAPKAVTVGNAKIIADQRSNSIIVLGNREVVVKVGKILDEMDVKAPQVALSTVIGELTLNNNEEFGVDWLKYGGTSHTDANGQSLARTVGNSNFAGFSRNSAAALVDPAGLINFTQLASAAASGGTNLFLSSARDGLSALVNLLDASGKFKVISRPMVFTTNNKKAIIASGTEIPVPVNTIQNAVGSNINQGLAQTSNIQFKKVALQLEVVPLINSEKEVTLDILQKLDSLAGSTIVSGNAIPNIATRYIKTTVSAPNCSTIVLGGLIMDEKRRSQTGVPLLSRIPVIGGLFRETAKVKNRTELIILMRPEVTLTKLDLYRLRQKTEDRTHFGPEMEQDDCPDCPKPGDGKQLALPAPDLPSQK